MGKKKEKIWKLALVQAKDFLFFLYHFNFHSRESHFAPWREGEDVKGHREFPKWRFWEIFGKGTPFLGNPQKPSVYGLFHDFKGKKWKRKKGDFPKNGGLKFIFGDFFPKMGVILGIFSKTSEKSPKTEFGIHFWEIFGKRDFIFGLLSDARLERRDCND